MHKKTASGAWSACFKGAVLLCQGPSEVTYVGTIRTTPSPCSAAQTDNTNPVN